MRSAGARRPRPRRHRHRRQPAAAGADAGCASASRSSRRCEGGDAGPRAARLLALGWYRGLPRGRGARRAAADAARRPALALHGAAAPAARQPQPARLRLRAEPVRAGRARDRLRARRGRARRCLERAAGVSRSSGCASACATRSTRSVADRRAAGVLAALAVGDQGAIERDDWDLFRNTGVAHLMSISGLHVTMFAWLAGLLRRRCCGGAAPRLMPALAGAAARRAGAASPRRPPMRCSRLGRAVAAHGLDARDRGAAAVARACAGRGRWCCCWRPRWSSRCSIRGRCCSRASGCRSWRSGC